MLASAVWTCFLLRSKDSRESRSKLVVGIHAIVKLIKEHSRRLQLCLVMTRDTTPAHGSRPTAPQDAPVYNILKAHTSKFEA